MLRRIRAALPVLSDWVEVRNQKLQKSLDNSDYGLWRRNKVQILRIYDLSEMRDGSFYFMIYVAIIESVSWVVLIYFAISVQTLNGEWALWPLFCNSLYSIR